MKNHDLEITLTGVFLTYLQFKKYDKYDIAAASLFLAAKVEENPRKVEHVLKAREEWTRKGREKEGERSGPIEIDTQSEDYQRKLNRLIDHEVSTSEGYTAFHHFFKMS